MAGRGNGNEYKFLRFYSYHSFYRFSYLRKFSVKSIRKHWRTSTCCNNYLIPMAYKWLCMPPGWLTEFVVTRPNSISSLCHLVHLEWHRMSSGWHTELAISNPGSAFIKPDQRNPLIKDQLGNALLSTIKHLQLPNFVLCGREKPSHMTQNWVTVGANL